MLPKVHLQGVTGERYQTQCGASSWIRALLLLQKDGIAANHLMNGEQKLVNELVDGLLEVCYAEPYFRAINPMVS